MKSSFRIIIASHPDSPGCADAAISDISASNEAIDNSLCKGSVRSLKQARSYTRLPRHHLIHICARRSLESIRAIHTDCPLIKQHLATRGGSENSASALRTGGMKRGLDCERAAPLSPSFLVCNSDEPRWATSTPWPARRAACIACSEPVILTAARRLRLYLAIWRRPA